MKLDNLDKSGYKLIKIDENNNDHIWFTIKLEKEHFNVNVFVI